MGILSGLIKTAVGFATGGPPGALLAAGSAIAGGLAQGKGSSKASDIAGQTSAQQLAFAQQTRDQNVRLQQPYMDLGQAGINPLLRQLGVAAPSTAAPASRNPLSGPMGSSPQETFDWASYRANNPDVDAAVSREGSGFNGNTPDERAADQYARYGQGEGRNVSTVQAAQPATPAPAAPSAPVNPFLVDPATGGVTAVRPDAGPRPTIGLRPEMARPTIGPRQEMNRPTSAPYRAPTRAAQQPFSFTAEQYRETPGYQYRQSEARKGILSSAGATGAMKSGAALKELYDRGDQIANQDFTSERAVNYGQYMDAANRSDANFTNDRNFGYGVYADETGRADANFTNDRAFGEGVYSEDRAFGEGVYSRDRAFGENAYTGDRAFNDNVFTTDRAYGDSRFDADRGYATNVFNNRTDDLFRLTGIGTNAASSVTSANNILAGQQIGATGQAGQAAATNAQNQGSIWSDTIGSAAGALYQGYQGYKDGKLNKAVASTIKNNPLLF